MTQHKSDQLCLVRLDTTHGANTMKAKLCDVMGNRGDSKKVGKMTFTEFKEMCV